MSNMCKLSFWLIIFSSISGLAAEAEYFKFMNNTDREVTLTLNLQSQNASLPFTAAPNETINLPHPTAIASISVKKKGFYHVKGHKVERSLIDEAVAIYNVGGVPVLTFTDKNIGLGVSFTVTRK